MTIRILVRSLLPTDSSLMMNCQGILLKDGERFDFSIMMKDNGVLTPARIPQALEDILDASLEFEDAETDQSGPCVVIPRVGRLYLTLFDPDSRKIEGKLIMTSCDDKADFDLCCENGNVCCKPEGFYGTEYEDICAGLKAILEENDNALPIMVQDLATDEVG